jgi:hypothetical protein
VTDRRTPDAKLIEAVRILSRTIQTDDGVISACLAEVATRLAELVEERKKWCTVDGYPGKFEAQPLPPGPEGKG